MVVGTLRRGEGGARRMVSSLAELWVKGVSVSWESVFAGTGAGWVELPTYAFQRERYWPDLPTAAGDVAGAGLVSAEHPLLGAMVALPGSGGMLFTGRLSLHSHPWLADHRVQGKVLFPGTGFVELAVRAGDAVGCDQVGELLLEAPLVIPEQGGCQVQLLLTEQDQNWSFEIHACPDGSETWTRHATGVLVDSGDDKTAAGDNAVFSGISWPPAGATTVDTSGLYDTNAGHDVAYGPVFQGLTRAWTQGDRVWAEVELPEAQWTQAAAFGMHPALLDAVLHAATFAGLDSTQTTQLPFMFTDVVLRASGATRVRVCVTRTGSDEVALAVADTTGESVLSIGSLVVRPLPEGALAAGSQDTVVLAPHWTNVTTTGRAPRTDDWIVVGSSADYADLGALATAVEYGTPVPSSVVLAVPHSPGPESGLVVGRVHEVSVWVLEQVQRWLA
ncbi:polyketide synthase dehydratase domain-containing protein, partial [Streptomyces sp. MH13]|uniref:polyketide synthase dehydratase domain-containing protein n=1 Tax=Streptomyces sp. MH13 TaxID=3417651 RepID=UPI003CF5415D